MSIATRTDWVIGMLSVHVLVFMQAGSFTIDHPLVLLGHGDLTTWCHQMYLPPVICNALHTPRCYIIGCVFQLVYIDLFDGHDGVEHFFDLFGDFSEAWSPVRASLETWVRPIRKLPYCRFQLHIWKIQASMLRSWGYWQPWLLPAQRGDYPGGSSRTV